MRLTTKGRFAVTAVLDLALREEEGRNAITLASISERQGISLSYLEQLFSRLRRQGIVSSSRGPGGGYRLARNAAEISIADVVRAVDEHIDATLCAGMRNCQGQTPCMTHDLWEGLNKHIYSYLTQVNLQTLRSQVRHKNVAQPKGPQVVKDPFFANLATAKVGSKAKAEFKAKVEPKRGKTEDAKSFSLNKRPTYPLNQNGRRYYGGSGNA